MGKKVLIVDDSKSIRQSIEFTLNEIGYESTEAVDGKDALDKFDSSIDLVISDLNMPNIDGIELIKELRAKKSLIPILMLTTESNSEKKTEGKNAGATGWIVKPFAPEQLQKTIHKVLK